MSVVYTFDLDQIDYTLRALGYNLAYHADRNTLAQLDKTNCDSVVVEAVPYEAKLDASFLLTQSLYTYDVIYCRMWVVHTAVNQYGVCEGYPILQPTVELKFRGKRGDHWVDLLVYNFSLNPCRVHSNVCGRNNGNVYLIDHNPILLNINAYAQMQKQDYLGGSIYYLKFIPEKLFDQLFLDVHISLMIMGAGTWTYSLGFGFDDIYIWRKDPLTELINTVALFQLVQTILNML